MKNLKIADNTHQELKRYGADNKIGVSLVANAAIQIYLSNRGHKFKPQKQLSKPKK